MKKAAERIIVGILAAVICCAGFFIYTGQYYHTEESVVEQIHEDKTVSYFEESMVLAQENAEAEEDEEAGQNAEAGQSAEAEENAEAGQSAEAEENAEAGQESATEQETMYKTGIIFYPGAKVEYSAYYPMMKQLQQQGYLCVLVKMPFNFAFFDANAADRVRAAYPDIEHWYMMGHSLGGAIASSYTAGHDEDIDGLILLGAYIYGDVPGDETLILYGENDEILDRTKIGKDDPVEVIAGGNHAGFGNYGEQKGDGKATITAEEQQSETVEKIIEFIESSEN